MLEPNTNKNVQQMLNFPKTYFGSAYILRIKVFRIASKSSVLKCLICIEQVVKPIG